MKVAFRVDAGLVIGTGHMMRCLTLAQRLRSSGANCIFLARNHLGNLHGLVEEHGFQLLPLGAVDLATLPPISSDSQWLGVEPLFDAKDTLKQLSGVTVDWLIVDHYGLGLQWERAVKSTCNRMLIIDDLANRSHAADAILNQNLGKMATDYNYLVPPHCDLMIGPLYAILRSEFAQMRGKSFSSRSQRPLRNILVTMGGVDLDDASGAVLDAIAALDSPEDLKVTVVLGRTAIWREKVKAQANEMPFHTEVFDDVKQMADLMCQADISIGAAGSTSWERCCMGLPTILLILADNQQAIAEALNYAGAALLIGRSDLTENIRRIFAELKSNPLLLSKMSDAAAKITDGNGADRVACQLERGL